MDGRFNTIAGWVLGAGIVLLGATLVTEELFKAERPETMGYPIAGVQEEGEGGAAAAAEAPIAHYLQTADATRGEAVFRKCQACHNADNGGANGLGPNLWSTVGNTIAHRPDFSYSDALHGHAGARWDWDTLSTWLRSPRAFAPGTKMTFAGLSNPQERADVLLFLNQHGGSLTIPPPPPEGAAAGNSAGGNAAAPAAGNASGGNASAGNASAGHAANAAAPAAGNAATPANAAAPAHH